MGWYSQLFIYDQNGLVSREVAVRDVEPKRAAAGHDKTVSAEFFFEREPTYFAPMPFRPDQSSRVVLRGLASHPMIDRVTIERHPIPPSEEFPAGSELWMLRLLPAAAPETDLGGESR